ncbi:MAG: DUF1476 domain-containing protein [Thalassobaculales bacterium]
MSGFSDREKEFESKFKLDQELRFKVTVRRNKLAGLWAAGLLGLAGEEAEGYARSVVEADFDRPGDEDVVEKLAKDFAAKGVDVSEHRIRKALEEKFEEARGQIMRGE